jgi:hypothetical protein
MQHVAFFAHLKSCVQAECAQDEEQSRKKQCPAFMLHRTHAAQPALTSC